MFESPEIMIANLDRLSRLVLTSGDPCLLLIEECKVAYANLPTEDHSVWNGTVFEDEIEDLFSSIEFFVDSCAGVGLDEDALVADFVSN